MVKMASPSQTKVHYLNVADPNFSVRSQAVKDARAQNWFAETPYGIAILRYDKLKEMLLHPMVRQGSYRWPQHNKATGDWAQWWSRIMLNLEGDDHNRLRRLAMPAFAPKRVKSLLPVFEAIANDLIDEFAGTGKCEFMKEFAEPYATRVMCALTGLPQEQWRELMDNAVKMGVALGVNYSSQEAVADAAIRQLFAFSADVIKARRATPQDDFVGALIAANEDKDVLSDQELQDMIVLTIFGGIDTTSSQIGLAMHTFIENPDQWRLLGQQPELARAAVEEVMRTRPTTTWVTREATDDFIFHGLSIKRGTTIHLFSESASTDPEHFCPGIDITAERKPHFGFGGGKHHCIGAPIARGDMATALATLAERIRNPRAGQNVTWLPDSGNTGPLTLEILFDPAP